MNAGNLAELLNEKTYQKFHLPGETREEFFHNSILCQNRQTVNWKIHWQETQKELTSPSTGLRLRWTAKPMTAEHNRKNADMKLHHIDIGERSRGYVCLWVPVPPLPEPSTSQDRCRQGIEIRNEILKVVNEHAALVAVAEVAKVVRGLGLQPRLSATELSAMQDLSTAIAILDRLQQSPSPS